MWREKYSPLPAHTLEPAQFSPPLREALTLCLSLIPQMWAASLTPRLRHPVGSWRGPRCPHVSRREGGRSLGPLGFRPQLRALAGQPLPPRPMAEGVRASPPIQNTRGRRYLQNHGPRDCPIAWERAQRANTGHGHPAPSQIRGSGMRRAGDSGLRCAPPRHLRPARRRRSHSAPRCARADRRSPEHVTTDNLEDARRNCRLAALKGHGEQGRHVGLSSRGAWPEGGVR